jgi:hypothetical protein
LYPSELVTIGILFALKGAFFQAFYRWLERDYGDWFGVVYCLNDPGYNDSSKLTKNGANC